MPGVRFPFRCAPTAFRAKGTQNRRTDARATDRPELFRGSWKAISAFVRRQEGVTLLEVLVVIMIMGFIATLGSIQLTKYFSRARVDTAKLQMNELSVALDLFKLDVGRYPSGSEGLAALLKAGAGISGWKGPYLKRDALLKDPWGRAYLYGARGEGSGFALTTLGADGRPGGENDNADIALQNE